MNVLKRWGGTIAQMAGTEGTGEYTIKAYSSRGRVGVRNLESEQVRIRVEPTPGGTTKKIARTLTRRRGWKQPGDNGETRFSTVVEAHEVERVLATARRALGEGHLKTFVTAG